MDQNYSETRSEFNPKLSIITVCFNSEAFLEETINSVLNQSYSNIEYLIIDGLSTDSTMDIARKYQSSLAYLISERDGSMYEAINKGLAKSTGDYIWVLNSDDCIFSPDIVSKIINAISLDPDQLGYYGDVAIKEGSIKRIRKNFQVNRQDLLLSCHCSFIPHPALIVSRKSLLSVSHYNEAFKYCSDYDYILNLLQIGKLKYLNIPFSIFRRHPQSITSSGKLTKERLAILEYHSYDKFNIIFRSLQFFLLWSKYKLINFGAKEIK